MMGSAQSRRSRPRNVLTQAKQKLCAFSGLAARQRGRHLSLMEMDSKEDMMKIMLQMKLSYQDMSRRCTSAERHAVALQNQLNLEMRAKKEAQDVVQKLTSELSVQCQLVKEMGFLMSGSFAKPPESRAAAPQPLASEPRSQLDKWEDTMRYLVEDFLKEDEDLPEEADVESSDEEPEDWLLSAASTLQLRLEGGEGHLSSAQFGLDTAAESQEELGPAGATKVSRLGLSKMLTWLNHAAS